MDRGLHRKMIVKILLKYANLPYKVGDSKRNNGNKNIYNLKRGDECKNKVQGHNCEYKSFKNKEETQKYFPRLCRWNLWRKIRRSGRRWWIMIIGGPHKCI